MDVKSLNERSKLIFQHIVESWMETGDPVGSRTLSRGAGLDVSAATIRNVMADLEDMGLITSPHTSAGRVPTVQGYRLFVDTMLAIKPLQDVQPLSFIKVGLAQLALLFGIGRHVRSLIQITDMY